MKVARNGEKRKRVHESNLTTPVDCEELWTDHH